MVKIGSVRAQSFLIEVSVMLDNPLGPLLDLRGKTALITGGSRGLGLQIAEALGEFGAHVILVARKADELHAAEETLRRQGMKVSSVSADLGQAAGVDALSDALKTLTDRVDILVNNAGATWGAATLEHPLSAWDKVVALNLTSVFLLTQAVAKQWMVPAKTGRVLNIASVEGLRGHDPNWTGTISYNTTKGGLVNFTRALAAEWGPLGITVNALAPGYFRSKMTAATIDKHEQSILARTPRGALGGPSDLKGAALLLVSDAGVHITGQILTIDGGYTVT
jgi:NAD(P)-dependent dehydrogenase (short-subunit alcohol dehydrogenase family)